MTEDRPPPSDCPQSQKVMPSSSSMLSIRARDSTRTPGACLVGAGIAVEKGFQPGGDLVRATGVRADSLAIIESMDEDTGVVFRHPEA